MFQKANEHAFRNANPVTLKSHITSAYSEIQEIVNNRSTEVLQLTTELQIQQLAYKLSATSK